MKLPWTKLKRPRTGESGERRPGRASRGGGTRQSWRVLLPCLLFIFVALMFAAHSLARRHSNADAEYVALMNDLKLRSQQVSREAQAAARGDVQGLSRMKAHGAEMQTILDRLRHGDAAGPLPPLPAGAVPQLDAVENSWRDTRRDIDVILAGVQAAAAMRENGKSLDALFSSARLTTQEVFGSVTSGTPSAEHVSLVSRQLVRLERMSIDVNRTLEGGADTAAAALGLKRDVSDFVKTTARLLGDDESDPGLRVDDPVARQGIERLASLFANRSGLIDGFLGGSESLLELHDAAQMIDADSLPFLQAVQALQENYTRASAAANQYTTAVIVFGILALSFLLMLGIQLIRDAHAHTEEVRRREQESRERNRRNQDSILKLLDEMSDLAEGDLTAYASVSEDITGAIADAFNYAIDALRHLVARIDNTSEAVAEAAQTSRTRAFQVSVASDRQNAEIIKAASTIQEMADSVERVSADAAESSDVAKRSVTIANKGAREVRQTIDGLDDIRLTIQDTAKRLKQLGESSHEIGAMVGLIDDIADQTNVLALNAAIQASMAGESGRGFAVVADEVQRLAERAGQTTKRIEQLVKAVQADTNEAIESMERSTTGVVSGALLAQGAGTSLDEIETVSRHLAKLIESISATSREQASRASTVAKTMSAIRTITTQTRAGAITTAKSVGNLADLAEALKTSVAGFRLPDSFDPNVVDLRAVPAASEDQPASKRESSASPVSDVRTFRPAPRQ
ncbi:MAG: methyl-accepting chemotaxis protein [Gammaproteobacteria bacterium]|nr:methyl-accepting chemotaxis protein [Gammaproteobacteria bacterium]MDX2458899.1 methyl-accepting chemotaxis protein [Gammaproteobacteria bacterium]